MADPLFELLQPYFGHDEAAPSRKPSLSDPTATTYLSRLTTLSLGSLTTTEPASLSQSSHSVLRSLQALSKRSHRSVINATDHLSNLSELLPNLDTDSDTLQDGLPALEDAANKFAKKYDRSMENAVLDRRKKAMQMNGNVDRVESMLELPTLLSSAIGSSSSSTGASTSGAATSGYSSALDVHAHVKRLRALYPESGLVEDVSQQSEERIREMITLLITALQSPSLKLAGAMRTIGWLRRVAPDLTVYNQPLFAPEGGRGASFVTSGSEEGSLGALFLTCRLATLERTLEALRPLQELADQESARRASQANPDGRPGGTQSERYLKRFLEIFREQSFSIISMYRSIFPSALPIPGTSIHDDNITSPFASLKSSTLPSAERRLQDTEPMPSALATFTLHITDLVIEALREYLPNIRDRSSRDSLLTQVLYCSGSLGRLGADFGMRLALLEEELKGDSEAQEEQPEWVSVMKKHRVQASRLELLASGVGTGAGSRKGSTAPGVRSPPPVTASAQ